ncbi:hypothetical protein LXA43DRAFT_883195 [Ganoderma leucocontextum]|nr:hypothetical protein LXA43DRAFT_883195 [Ganoderma leucocontextum]
MVALLAFTLVPALCVAHVAAALYPARTVNPADDPNRTPSPPILQPNHEVEWQALEVQTVTWDTTGLDVTGLNGTILLGFVRPDTTRFVYQDRPIAQNFALADEAVNIILPDVPTGNRYFLILLGNMNNTSPLFGIAGTDQNNPTNSLPPSTLPPQTITTRSATITRTDIVSTVGGASTSAVGSTSLTSAEPSSSGTGVPNSASAAVISTSAYSLGAVLALLFTIY